MIRRGEGGGWVAGWALMALNPENLAMRTRKHVRPWRARRREPPAVPTQRRVAHKEVCSWHLPGPKNGTYIHQMPAEQRAEQWSPPPFRPADTHSLLR